MKKKSEKNLPLYGIGPVIVFGQLLIAGGAIAISYKFKCDLYEYEKLNIPLKIIGILSVIDPKSRKIHNKRENRD